MENVSMIAAIGKNNELGCNNKLIWRLPNDLKFFKNVTMGKDIVMGSNTFYSMVHHNIVDMTGFRSDSGTLSYFSRKFCRCFSLIEFK